MLDNQTKRLIDSARDILVGKVPDPKGQIEHITIALIYKFMDDMDNETVMKFGGKAKYFTGEYEQYSWQKLFDARMGGHEMLALYREAIDKMYLNPNIPDLFKSIFKNAYLSFNSPETLKMFLKNINEFNYDHSENLGNAYEYLLSVLGTQGDAGQFRTPRHIIEFIVACVDPQKHESILDPACGTAGFILSSYKHILKHNDSHFNAGGKLLNDLPVEDDNNGYRGDKLTPDERKLIAENLVGFDIDPNMVRFSLVNMFLHKFQTPHIYEYDTLSSEDRWNEYYDVIVANPPFMTPKGGIKPHKRFSIQATKSEVLFTDYMAEHLTPNGRAGIIVPNGIIATTQTAYKSLRKMLVENYLVAVVSLPAGVFNPYSGVKTSILLLDKKLSKKTDSILFLKVENDGYDLGAQRREIEKNDLPEAIRIFSKYKISIIATKEFEIEESGIATLIRKETVLANKDVNLSAERYFKITKTQTEFDLVTLGEIGKICMCKRIFKEQTSDKGDIPFYKIGTFGKEADAFISHEIFDEYKSKFAYPKKGDILISTSGTIGKIVVFDGKPAYFQDSNIVWIANDETKISNEFLKIIYQQIKWRPMEGVTIARLYNTLIEETEIPLPPLEIQQQIVAEIEIFQKIIDGAKMVVDNYKPTIKIKAEWEMVEIGAVCVLNPQKSELKDLSKETIVSFVPMSDINENNVNFIPNQTRKVAEVYSGYTYFKNDDVLVAKVTPCFENGKAGIASYLENGIGFGSSELFVLRCREKILPMWAFLQVTSKTFRTIGKAKMSGTSGLQRIPKDFISSYQIPLPSIEEQTTIVAQIEEEQKIVDSTKNLISLYEQKIKDRIAEVWGEKELKLNK